MTWLELPDLSDDLMRVELETGVVIERFADHVLTTLPSGETSANWPHPDDESYVSVAQACGFAPDRLIDYCFEHEVLHSLLPLRLFGRPGYTVRMAAQGKKADLAGAMAEERLISYVQRWGRHPAGCAAQSLIDGEVVQILEELTNGSEGDVSLVDARAAFRERFGVDPNG